MINKKLLCQKKILLLDNNNHHRESTSLLLQSMHFNVEAFAHSKDALNAIALIHNNEEVCLLLDIQTPVQGSFDVHDTLIDQGLSIPVVYMSAGCDVPVAVSAMSKGALTLLEKPLDKNALQRALTAAFSHAVQLRRRVRANSQEFEKTRERLDSLTRRESQIVQGILGDMSNHEIANEFNISTKTVELYRSKVMSKLDAKNAAHLVRLVMACEPA